MGKVIFDMGKNKKGPEKVIILPSIYSIDAIKTSEVIETLNEYKRMLDGITGLQRIKL